MSENKQPHKLQREIIRHALHEYPRESCGLLVSVPGNETIMYNPCDNIHPDPLNAFSIWPAIITAALIKKSLVAVVHSHPRQSTAVPSDNDIRAQKAMGVPWLIVPVGSGKAGAFCWIGRSKLTDLAMSENEQGQEQE